MSQCFPTDCNLLLNYYTMMLFCENELASHDCFLNMAASLSFESQYFNNIGFSLMTSPARGEAMTSANEYIQDL